MKKYFDDTLLFFRKGVAAGVLAIIMPAMLSSTLGLEIVLNLRLTALQKFLIYWFVAAVSLPNLSYRVLSTTTSISGLTTEGADLLLLWGSTVSGITMKNQKKVKTFNNNQI